MLLHDLYPPEEHFEPVTVKGKVWSSAVLRARFLLDVEQQQLWVRTQDELPPEETPFRAALYRTVGRSHPGYIGWTPKGGQTPSDVRPDCNLYVSGGGFKPTFHVSWHWTTPLVRDDGSIAHMCVDRHHVRYATSQEVRDYLCSCVERGLMTHRRAVLVQEFWLGGGPLKGDPRVEVRREPPAPKVVPRHEQIKRELRELV